MEKSFYLIRLKILISFIIFTLNYSFAQISPGELSQSHAKWDGLKNCTNCHTLGEGLSNNKCLDCHKEIKTRIDNNRGYHSSNEVKGKECWTCHSEHNGRNFNLIKFNTKSFNHSKTGYDLTGKHKEIECKDCHNKKFIFDKELSKKASTFLGLNKNCVNCHEDVHKNSAGTNCESCHNTRNFNKEIKFNHNKTHFSLRGAHQTVKCSDCHKKNETAQKIELIFVANRNPQCIDCHEDIHKGKFGKNCLECHNFNSFTQTATQKFDHSKTNFPLIGKHQFVECKECHKQKFTLSVKHDKCIDCHLDYHKGQFKTNNQIRDCKDCHNEQGFTPSNFSIVQHQKTKFVLVGSHLAVECKSCHLKKDEWKFKFENTQCFECHENVHKSEISQKFFGKNECENCHNTLSWKVVKFDHNLTRFSLRGKHSLIACSDCHIKNQKGIKTHLFKSIKSDCLSCHEDFHYNQYSSSECENCHTYDSWKTLTFNHDKAKFKLDGAHKKVECIKCHPKIERNDKPGFYYLFKTGRVKCSDCHFS